MKQTVTISEYIQIQATKGRRAADIAKDIATRFPDKPQWQVDRMVRTEVSKMQTANIRSRAERLSFC